VEICYRASAERNFQESPVSLCHGKKKRGEANDSIGEGRGRRRGALTGFLLQPATKEEENLP